MLKRFAGIFLLHFLLHFLIGRAAAVEVRCPSAASLPLLENKHQGCRLEYCRLGCCPCESCGKVKLPGKNEENCDETATSRVWSAIQAPVVRAEPALRFRSAAYFYIQVCFAQAHVWPPFQPRWELFVGVDLKDEAAVAGGTAVPISAEPLKPKPRHVRAKRSRVCLLPLRRVVRQANGTLRKNPNMRVIVVSPCKRKPPVVPKLRQCAHIFRILERNAQPVSSCCLFQLRGCVCGHYST